MFDASQELLDEEDERYSSEWRVDDAEITEPFHADTEAAEAKFSHVVSLLKKAETLKPSIEGQDAQDIEALCENLKNAMSADDPAAVARFSEELDDILFYVR
jgi:hypothetical protein